MKYSPKGGFSSGSYIKLFFDAENFHHLRTEYRQMETEQGLYDAVDKSRPQQSTGDWDSGMAANGSTLTGSFDDIRDEGGLTVPHKYSILLNLDGINGTNQYTWTFIFKEYRVLKEFPAGFFSFKN